MKQMRLFYKKSSECERECSGESLCEINNSVLRKIKGVSMLMFLKMELMVKYDSEMTFHYSARMETKVISQRHVVDYTATLESSLHFQISSGYLYPI